MPKTRMLDRVRAQRSSTPLVWVDQALQGRSEVPPTSEEMKRYLLEEYGATGTENISGFLTNTEYNPDLRGQAGLRIYDEMRRSDAQVHASLSMVMLPLRAATWKIEPGGDSREDLDIANFVKNVYFNDMLLTWDDLLRHTLLHLTFGFMVFEKVFQYDETTGRLVYKNLSPRLPRTIYQWIQTEPGALHSVVQYAYHPNTRVASSSDSGRSGLRTSMTPAGLLSSGPWSGMPLSYYAGEYRYTTIPASKLLLFTHQREGDNFEGISLLRSAYRSWYIKSTLYKISSIRHDRYGVGIPVIKLPPGYSKDDVVQAQEIVANIRVHEQSWAILPPGYELEIISPGASAGTDPMGDIEHHNAAISANVLGQFMDLGKQYGSFALSRSMSDLFFLSLLSVAEYIEDVHNREAIPDLVRKNFRTNRFPKLRCSDLRPVDFEGLSAALFRFASAGVITPGPELETWARSELGLPAKTYDPESRVAPVTSEEPEVDEELPEAAFGVEDDGTVQIHGNRYAVATDRVREVEDVIERDREESRRRMQRWWDASQSSQVRLREMASPIARMVKKKLRRTSVRI
jgi:hypothetical protein